MNTKDEFDITEAERKRAEYDAILNGYVAMLEECRALMHEYEAAETERENAENPALKEDSDAQQQYYALRSSTIKHKISSSRYNIENYTKRFGQIFLKHPPATLVSIERHRKYTGSAMEGLFDLEAPAEKTAADVPERAVTAAISGGRAKAYR